MHKLSLSSSSKAFAALGNVPFGRHLLMPLLAEYKRPNDKIARWLASGDLVPLRKGLYVLGQGWRTAPLSLPLVANVLFGPSYVSLEFALSAHGLIPESVAVVTSVTTRRGREIDTPLGLFSYTHLPWPLYGVDMRMEKTPDGTSFLMASPTQAVCDLVVLSKRFHKSGVKAMREFLFEDMRIDPEIIATLNKDIIAQSIAVGRKSRQLQALLACVESLS